MKAIARTEPRYRRGDALSVVGMPSYGHMPVRFVKWSAVSGWWYELLDEFGGTWAIPESQIVGRP